MEKVEKEKQESLPGFERNFIRSLRFPKNHELKSLLELAQNGHYPLFYTEWIVDSFKKTEKMNLSPHDIQHLFNDILTRMAQHKKIDRKRTVLHALKDSERRLFVRTFLGIVEDKYLDQSSQLH